MEDEGIEEVAMPRVFRAQVEIDEPMLRISHVYDHEKHRAQVKSLLDSGADVDLISESLVHDLDLETIPLKKAIRLGSVKENHAMTLRTAVDIRHRIARKRTSHRFILAPLQGEPQIICGRPWMRTHCPELLDTIVNYGKKQKPTISGGGEQKPLLTQKQARVLHLFHTRSQVCEALDWWEEQEAMVARVATGGDPGIRGLTGNKEGWEDTIPPEFKKYSQTVFSDRVLQERAPPRPGFECKITLKEGETLKKQDYYQLPPHQLANLKALIDNEIASGISVPSSAPHASPGFFVTDPGSKQERWVVNYQELNAKSLKDAYPLPRINTIIERASGSRYISVVDVSKAFSMIPMHPDSQSLTAYTTPFGMFEYTSMPMGLANAPSIWQRFLNSILGPLLHDICFAYVDDIVIFSETREQHILDCKKVLDVLEQHGLHLKPHKCQWFREEVEFLGFTIVAGRGVRMSDDKLQGIRDMERPRRVKDLRMLLGTLGFYDKFIPHYSDYTACMTDLLKKDVPWEWKEDPHERAFQKLKESFCKDVFLVAADPEKPYRLSTDASDVAYAGKIEQQDELGNWRPVLMFSHKFKDGEKGWDGPDKELYAIVHAFTTYRRWLSQPKHTVEVYSDHRNLAKFMFTSNLLKSHDGRLGRWWQELSQCNFVINYTPGTENVVPDFLSRYNLEDSVDLDPSQLLPAHRFSPKALADIDAWFRSAKDAEGIRKRLETSFSLRPDNDNSAMRKLLESKKLNDSSDPVPTPTDASVNMAPKARLDFLRRYVEEYPSARLIELGRRYLDGNGENHRWGLGYQEDSVMSDPMSP
jgi:hypothetical protein